MRRVLTWAVLALSVGAQAPDPASLMPTETTIFVEAQDLAGFARTLKESRAFTKARSDENALPKMLQDVALTGTKTFALGIAPAAIGPDKWVLILETPDPSGTVALVRSWKGQAILSATAPPFLVVASSDKALASTMDLSEGKGNPLSDRPDFKAFRAASAVDAPVRFHVDVQQMWPRPFRSQVRNSPNIWSVLLGCHLNHVVKTVGVLSGTLTVKDGLRLSILGDIRATDSRAVTEGHPGERVIAPPAGTAFLVSVPRNLTYFWARRSTLLPEPAQSRLTELEARVAAHMPGWTVEQLLGQLGEACDLYIAPGDSMSEGGQGMPAMALVLVSVDPPHPGQMEVLRSFFGLVSATLAEEPVPTCPRIETRCHRGVAISISKTTTPAVIAKVNGRILVANQEALVMKLIDAALDRGLSPRTPGDDIVISGPAAARVVRDAQAMLATGWLSTRMGSEEKAKAFLDVVQRVLPEVQAVRLRFDLEGPQVKLDLEVAERPPVEPAPPAK